MAHRPLSPVGSKRRGPSTSSSSSPSKPSDWVAGINDLEEEGSRNWIHGSSPIRHHFNQRCNRKDDPIVDKAHRGLPIVNSVISNDDATPSVVNNEIVNEPTFSKVSNDDASPSVVNNEAVSNDDASRSVVNNEANEPVFIKFIQLHPWSNNVNLTVKVVSTKNVRLLKNPTKDVAECLDGDETGMVVFRAWGDQQVRLMLEGSTITLQNAKIYLFEGSMRLGVFRDFNNDGIEVAEPADFIVMEDNNLSLIEFERIKV